MTLYFSDLSTESGFDRVTITACSTVACTEDSEVLAIVDGFSPPDSFSSVTGIMKVAFTSDDNSDSMFKGFSAQYEAFGGRATNCPSADDPDVLAIGLTEQGIVDFWNDDAYLNNAQCRWILNLQGGAGVLELNFPRFQTESLYDTVRISECADAACTVVDTFGGEVVSGTVDPTMNYTTASAYVRPSPSLRDSSRFMHDWSFCPYRAAAMLELTTQGRAWLDRYWWSSFPTVPTLAVASWPTSGGASLVT